MSTPSQHGYYYPEFIGAPPTSENMSQNPEKNYQLHGIYHQRPKNYAMAEPSIYTVQHMNQGQTVEGYPNAEYGTNMINPYVSIPPANNMLDHHLNQVPQQPPHVPSSSNLIPQNNHSAINAITSRNHQHQLSNSSNTSSTTVASVNSGHSMRHHSRASSISTTNNDYPEPVKPRIATTFWEEENTVCYQVKARGVLVSRRGDTNYINGTKLLNVIGMTRGKRDGILKAEKNRTVIKVGSMNLKGVWIPFNRAAEIARNEGIDNDDLLGPLFVKNISDYYKTKAYKLKSEGAVKTIIGDTNNENNSYLSSSSYGPNGPVEIIPPSGVNSKPLTLKNNYFDTKSSSGTIKEEINYYNDVNKT